jgi:DNA-directed RNA polymerase beta subunit
MPIVDGKTCEVIMNPYSTINRKIPSVIMECFLGNVAVKIHDLVDQYKKTQTGRKKIMPMMKKYYPGRYDDMEVEDFINLHNNKPMEEVYYFNVGCFSSYTPEKVQKMMDELGVKSSSEVLMPETDVTDLEELKRELPPEEYEKVVKEMEGKFRKVDKPLMAGYVTMLELYHIPSYSNKVTSDMITNTRNAQPIAPRGAIRSTGQKIGELELSALISRGAFKYIRSYRAASEKEQNQRFIDNLLSLGLMIVDQNGYAVGGSALKTRVEEMKRKYGQKKGGGV